MIRSARGSMGCLLELRDKSDLRRFAVQLFSRLLKANSIMSFSFPPEIKERKTALFTAQVFQQVLRDGRILQTGDNRLPLIHAESRSLSAAVSALGRAHLDMLLEKAFALERDIASYKDTLLSFEYFASYLKSPPGESGDGWKSTS